VGSVVLSWDYVVQAQRRCIKLLAVECTRDYHAAGLGADVIVASLAI
jgi:hypothetical protein